MFWEKMISETMIDYFNRIGFVINPYGVNLALDKKIIRDIKGNN